MITGALFWIVIFIVSALLFFGIAIVVTIRGTQDLRDLLSGARHKEQAPH